ncbi:tryptophan synthase subunit alpha [Bernardetia sp.]|uniref:tryptophan synthase subunit alpha n=1 Tax=Bernardetia sp. TaxID=1937974 RepID=UPI0025BF34CE|nr:tryptophan synthase subunit alpha [Bernardetia sp.]
MQTATTTKNRIDSLFQNKSNGVLTIYFTAGFPKLDDTRQILTELAEAGTDLIEIGMPFSDPIADGETIQYSNKIALDNGMSIKKMFEQLEGIRNESGKIKDTPIVLMGYINPVLQFGIENFCKKCQEIGIDGLILPDLPVFEYETTYKSIFKQYGLHTIFLITPQTSDERIKKIDDLSSGFVYMVSSNSTTGKTNSSELSEKQSEYFNKIKNLKLKNPTQIGFGISDKKTFQQATSYANGAIIGSAFIRHLESGKSVKEFVTSII